MQNAVTAVSTTFWIPVFTGMTDRGRRNHVVIPASGQIVIPAKAGIQSSRVGIKVTHLLILQLAQE